MQIIRNDRDAVVLQHRGSLLLVFTMTVVLFLALAKIVWDDRSATGRNETPFWLTIAALDLYALCTFVCLPYKTTLAFERNSRRMLYLRKYLGKTSREVLDFDKVQQVDVWSEPRYGLGRPRLTLVDGRTIVVGIFRSTDAALVKQQCAERVSLLREVLACEPPESSFALEQRAAS